MRPLLVTAALLLAGPAWAETVPNLARFVVALGKGEIVALGKGEVVGLGKGEIVPLGGDVQQVSVQETPHETRIRLPADILFDFDKAVLRPSAAPALAQAADLMRKTPATSISIEGHTDAKGKDAYNARLSLKRAEAVRASLARAVMLDPRRVAVNGYAARRPVAPNTKPDGSDDPDGRQLNRRVEIVLTR